MLRKILFAMLVGTFAISTSACNTVRGAGDDLQSAANAVDEET